MATVVTSAVFSTLGSRTARSARFSDPVMPYSSPIAARKHIDDTRLMMTYVDAARTCARSFPSTSSTNEVISITSNQT